MRAWARFLGREQLLRLRQCHPQAGSLWICRLLSAGRFREIPPDRSRSRHSESNLTGSPSTPRMYLNPSPATACRSTPDRTQLVFRPQSRSGCRLRSYGGSQRPDGSPAPSGVLAGRGLLRFCGHLRNERGPGHQFECEKQKGPGISRTLLSTGKFPILRPMSSRRPGALASGFGRPNAACDDWNTIESGDYLIPEFVLRK